LILKWRGVKKNRKHETIYVKVFYSRIFLEMRIIGIFLLHLATTFAENVSKFVLLITHYLKSKSYSEIYLSLFI